MPGIRQIPRGDQAVAAVVALAADDPHRPVQRQLANRLRHRPPGASISSSDGTPISSIAQRSTARIPSASWSGLSQDSMRRSLTRSPRGVALLQADDQLRRRQVVWRAEPRARKRMLFKYLFASSKPSSEAGDEGICEAQGGGTVGEAADRRVAESGDGVAEGRGRRRASCPIRRPAR
jgi:hypothetical protein